MKFLLLFVLFFSYDVFAICSRVLVTESEFKELLREVVEQNQERVRKELSEYGLSPAEMEQTKYLFGDDVVSALKNLLNNKVPFEVAIQIVTQSIKSE